MKKIIQFILLIIYMILINLIGHFIGIFFIEGYSQYAWYNFDFLGILIMTSFYSLIQIYMFPIHKKYRECVIPIFTLLMFLYLLYSSDPDGYGFEMVDSTVSLMSKIIVLFTFIVDYITNDSIRINFINLLYSLGYSTYLFIIFRSFKYLIKYIPFLDNVSLDTFKNWIREKKKDKDLQNNNN